MAYLICHDNLQNFGRVFIFNLAQFINQLRGDIQTARFEYQQGNRQPTGQIRSGFYRRFPQPVMGRQGAIETAQPLKAVMQQGEMAGFITGNQKASPAQKSKGRP